MVVVGILVVVALVAFGVWLRARRRRRAALAVPGELEPPREGVRRAPADKVGGERRPSRDR